MKMLSSADVSRIQNFLSGVRCVSLCMEYAIHGVFAVLPQHQFPQLHYDMFTWRNRREVRYPAHPRLIRCLSVCPSVISLLIFLREQADRGFARSRLLCTDEDGTTINLVLYTWYGMIHQKRGGRSAGYGLKEKDRRM